MIPLVLNRESLHFKLASLGDFVEWREDQQNICAYTRCVMRGLLVVLFVTVIFTLLSYAFMDFFMGIIFSIAYKTFIFSELGEAVMAILGVVGIGLSLFFIAFKVIPKLWKSARGAVSDTKFDNFVSESYSSWKEKHCKRIEFK